MSKHTSLTRFSLAVCALIVFAGTAAAAPARPAGRHCIVKASRTQAKPAPRPKISACYDTFSDAVFAATGGRIRLSESEPFAAQLDTLEREQKSIAPQLSEASTFIVAVDYVNSNFGGSTLSWTSTAPCSPNFSWAASSMPAGWDNVVSSTRGLSYCDQNVLWENPNWSGVTQTCSPDCSNLGAMNDQTSSREWHPVCTGTSGQWAGCRGTGCHVCSEKVAGFACYFVNHPKCVSNGTCDGQYFTCNQDCPAPTANDIC
jgi:hypothetical protein